MALPSPAPPTRSPDPLPGLRLQPGFRLREGQAAFLTKWAEALRRGERNALGVFVPGYGKTLTALAAFVVAKALGVADRLVVFVPRGNLRDQYADAGELARTFEALGAPPLAFCTADSDRVFLKNLDTDVVVTTYQYASGARGNSALRDYCRRCRALFVFDEVHHLASDGTWAAAIARFPHEATVALSGTPVRSDHKTLFGVPHWEDADGNQFYEALHEVTMREAHAEGGILKRVDAHVVDYTIQMLRGDTGERVEMTLSDLRERAETSAEVDTFLARRKLRFHEVYLDTLLGPAFRRFAEKRKALAQALVKSGRAARPFRNHQLLVIAMSNRHAAAILDVVQRRYPDVTAGRIGQDVPAAERAALLDRYREGRLDVMVQVDMIGEGTDIKPISVIVKADLVRAPSKTMQQVFRGMRHYADWPEDHNRCDLYAADDSDVVATLRWIADEAQWGVRKRTERATRELAEAPAAPSEHSVWELTHVQQAALQTHSLEQMQRVRSSRDFHRTAPAPEAAPRAVDVAKRERALRRQCAQLAKELALALQAQGRAVAVRDVHLQAKRRLSKAQGDLSLAELERKRLWLERSLAAGRMV
ncbi:MAG: DEAD/DEAH box helicase family protein [Rubricoccaceae bacterium]|nr:DEAD/DEAH box helicase family protein [Rubricoccaceae bacterium]